MGAGWSRSLTYDRSVPHEIELREYYEEEARQRVRTAVRGPRVDIRTRFVSQLRAASVGSVVDFGAGPGGDGEAFVEAGFRFVGVDIAHGNCRLAAENGVLMVQSSMAAPPFAPRSFDAGWSMSALMHLPEVEVPDAAAAMAAVLRPGAPLVIGMWGGDLGTVMAEDRIPGLRRFFDLRPVARNVDLLAACGTLDDLAVWDVGPEGWNYQVLWFTVDR